MHSEETSKLISQKGKRVLDPDPLIMPVTLGQGSYLFCLLSYAPEFGHFQMNKQRILKGKAN